MSTHTMIHGPALGKCTISKEMLYHIEPQSQEATISKGDHYHWNEIKIKFTSRKCMGVSNWEVILTVTYRGIRDLSRIILVQLYRDH